MKLGIAAFAADGGKSGIGQYLVNVIPRLTRLEPTLRTVIFIARSDYALLAGQVEPAALVAVPDWMAFTFATEPLADWAMAIRPGTPHGPPLSQGLEPGGLEIQWASNPPMG